MAVPLKRDAPELRAPFAEQHVDPRNREVARRGGYFEQREPMTLRERRAVEKALADCEKRLSDVHYDELRVEVKALTEAYQASEGERVVIQSTGETLDRRAAAARGRRMTETLKRWKVIANRRDELLDALDQDERLLLDVEASRDKKLLLLENAKVYARIIIETWSGLGFLEDKKHKKRKVEFERIDITPEAIFYKIKMSSPGLFRRRRAMPEGVRVMQNLLADATISELTAACERVVKPLPTTNNGAWLMVSLLETGDDLPPYISLPDVLSYFPKADRRLMPVPLGVSNDNNVEFLYLASASQAHLLVAGTTGGAKSNYLKVYVLSLIHEYTPDEVQFVLIDLKEGGIEFRPYEKLPHLLCPVLTQVEDIPAVFQQLEGLMKDRGARFNEVGVRNIVEYNAQAAPEKRMAHIHLVFDEFASIWAPKKRKLGKLIHEHTVQLLQKGRAFGVHVLICTQYPNVDVVASIGKANLATRICGPFPQKSASLAVFDSGIAAELPNVPGRMAALVNGTLFKVQTPHAVPEFERKLLARVLGASRVEKPASGSVLPTLTARAAAAVDDAVKDALAASALAETAALAAVEAEQAEAPALPVEEAVDESDADVLAAKVWRTSVLQCAGSLSARVIHPQLRGQLTLLQVQQVIAALLAGDRRVVVDGVEYVVRSRQGQRGGRGFMLVEAPEPARADGLDALSVSGLDLDIE